MRQLQDDALGSRLTHRGRVNRRFRPADRTILPPRRRRLLGAVVWSVPHDGAGTAEGRRTTGRTVRGRESQHRRSRRARRTLRHPVHSHAHGLCRRPRSRALVRDAARERDRSVCRASDTPSQRVMRQSLPMAPRVTVIMAMFTVTVPGAGVQVDTSDPGNATAIEQALIEHACSATRSPGAPDTDAYHECLSAQLLSLRNDLGRDLGRLSSAERRTLDSVCSDIRAAGGREAYLECLSARLTAVRDRRKSATPAPSPVIAITSPPVSAPASRAPPARQASSRSSALWIGATLLTLFVAVGGVLLAARTRRVPRAPRTCRVCGEAIPESGDLCQKCRHEAAEAVRGAALARADQQR